MEIKTWLIENYQLLLFFVSLGLCFLGFASWFIRSMVKDEINDLRKLSKKVIEINEYNSKYYIITSRITRDIIIPLLCNTEHNRKIVIQSLFNVGITSNDLQDYQMDIETIKELKLIENESEKEEIKSQN